MKKIKIGAYVHMYPPYHNAGAELMLHSIFVELQKRGFDCVVGINGSLSPAKEYVIEGIRVGKIDILEDCDIIFTHLTYTREALLYSKLKRKKSVFVAHNHTTHKVIKSCDLAIYNTEYLKKHYPIAQSRFSCVVHPPVDPDKYLVQTNRKYITLINLSAEKGGEIFFNIARMLPDHKFLGVVGGYGKQIVYPVLNVDLMQNQIDAREIYRQTRILLMPSIYESYGRVAIEAAINGIPVIANKTPGLSEALGETAVWAKMNPEHFAQRILEVDNNYNFYSQRVLERAATLDFQKEIDNLAEILVKL